MNAVAESWEWNGVASAPGAKPDAAEWEPTPGSLINGRYRLDRIIGRGGMATVFCGYDTRLAREVAIKVSRLASQDAVTSLREEHASSGLAHPNIVAIYDAGEIEGDGAAAGAPYIVMELVRGATAHQIAPVPWQRAVTIVRQAAEGLAAAHAQGIVHCDVKPSNILIARDGRAVVTDFGVAAVVQSAVGEIVHGSPAFIAPERIAGEPPDPRVDVYGLGGTLAFLLTGRLPDNISLGNLPADCPVSVRRVITKARALDPRARFDDAAAFGEELDRAIAEAGNRDHRIPDSEVTTRATVVRPLLTYTGLDRKSVTYPSGPRERRPQRALERPADADFSIPRPGLGTVAMTVVIVGVVALLTAIMIARTVDVPAAGSTNDSMIVEMPDVRDRSFSEALNLLTRHGLDVERMDVIYGPGPLNWVVAQEPAPGVTVTSGDAVRLVVRTGR